MVEALVNGFFNLFLLAAKQDQFFDLTKNDNTFLKGKHFKKIKV